MRPFFKSLSGTRLPIPDYANGCITQLPAFFQNSLLGDRPNYLSSIVADKLPLSGAKNVVFFLVDGFGARQWEKYKANYRALQRFEQDGFYSEIDSVFPASTPVALNALHTNGLMPIQHGLVDWWLYVEEIDKIIATLPFTTMGNTEMDSLLKIGANPSILVSNKTTYEVFEESGIETRTLMPKAYAKSAYTNVAYKGSAVVPHENVHELFENLSRLLQKPQERPSYSFVYWSDIDVAGHKFGPDEIEYKEAVDGYFTALDRFLSKIESIEDTLFAISADHGQVKVNPKETIYLDELTGLSDLLKTSAHGRLILPWGGPREVFVSIKDGQIDNALKTLQAAIGDRVELLKSKEALEAGLFGKALSQHPRFLSRIGDIVILPKGDKTVWYHHPDEKPLSVKGHHGGLSDSELKIPFGLLYTPHR